MGLKSNPKIKMAAYVVAVAAVLSAIFAFMSTISMGFPDGHLTEFDREIKPLFIGYSILASLFGILFFIQGFYSNQDNIKFRFFYSLGLYSLIVIALVIAYFYLLSTMDTGGGG